MLINELEQFKAERKHNNSYGDFEERGSDSQQSQLSHLLAASVLGKHQSLVNKIEQMKVQ